MHSTGLDLINDKYMGIFDELIEPSRQTYDAERGEAVDLAKSGPMSDFYGKLGFRPLLERITDETRAMEAAERAREAELARAATEVGAPFAPRLRRPEDNAIRPPRTPPGPDLIDRYLPQPTHPQNPYTAEQAKVGRELLRGAADVLGLNPAYRALTTPLSEEEQKEFFFTEALPTLFGMGGGRLVGGGVRKLAMDEASRMARARDMGFLAKWPLAHGTSKEFSSFDLARAGTMTGTPQSREGVWLAHRESGIADEFAELAAKRMGGYPMLMPLLHRADNPGVIKLTGRENPHEIAGTIADAWQRGFDAVMLTNARAPSGKVGDFWVVRNPNQLRSQFAKFDPARRDSSDLLAGLGGATVISPGFADFADTFGAKPKNSGP